MTSANVHSNDKDQLLNQLAENFGLKTKGQSLGEAAYSLVSQQVASKYSPNIEEFGSKIGKSEQAGKFLGAAWRTVVPMGLTAYNSSKDIRKTMSNYLNLNSDYKRSLNASGSRNMWIFSNPSQRPEVIINESKLLGGKAKNDTKSMVVSLMLDIPNVLATHMNRVIDELDPKKSGKTRKKKSDLDEFAQEQHKVGAEKINKKIDAWLDNMAVDGEGEDRVYDGVLNSALEMFNDGEGLESLNNAEDRYKAVRGIKSKLLGPIITVGSSTLKPTLTKAFDVRSNKEFQKPSAGKMIKALEEHMKKNPTPVSLNLSGCSKKECSLEEYIVDIFAQHQKDCGREEISRRMQGNLTRAAGQIAEAMTDPHRQLHPEALVLLVDKKHGITSFKDGGMTSILHGDDLDAHLAEMLQKQPDMSRRNKVSVTKQYKHYESTREQFSESWQQLTSEEKFLWSTFLSNEILSDLGVSKEDLQQLRHQDNELWRETMEEVLRDVSHLSSTELRNSGLNETQVDVLREAIAGVGKRNSNYLQKNRQEMTDLIADTATLMDSKKPGFLKDILQRAQKNRNHKDIVNKKDSDKPLAEQVLESRSRDSGRHKK